MSVFYQYKQLLGVLIKNSFRLDKLTRVKSGKGKVFAIISIVIAVLFLLAFLVLNIVFMTISLGAQGLLDNFIYMIIFGAQLIVLLFGSMSIMSYMFFSKDNQVLRSLPIDTRAIFMAKFSMAYIAELLFSTLILLPSLTTIGVVGMIYGFGIPWYFFIIEILAIFLTPIIPLLVATLISMPLMYVVSFFKKKKVGNGIVLALLYVAVMAVYFVFIFSTSGSMGNMADGDMAVSSGLIVAMQNIKKITIFNYPLVQALMGKTALLNIFVYIVSLTIVLGLAIFLASFFYKKGMASLADGIGASKSRKTDTKVDSQSLAKAFLYKEIKTLINTPILLMTTLLGIFMSPLLVFIMSFSFGGETAGIYEGNKMFLVGMITYISYLLTASTNQIGTIGFSREGKNLFVLKSLPIPAKVMVNSKLYFAMAVTCLSALLIGIVFPIATKITSVSTIIGLPLLVIIGGYGINCMGILNDLKNPNLKWNNVSELTKNNTRILKPMLTSLAMGFIYLLSGIGLGFQKSINGELLYLIYYTFCLISATIIAIVNSKRLFKHAESLLAQIEG